MARQDLLSALSALHQELAHGGDVDEPTKELLVQLSKDIEHMLQRSLADNPEQAQELRSRLSRAVNEFEDKHPRLTMLLGQVTDLLANLGI